MTKEDIIAMAQEVGFSDGEIDTCQLMLERFANLVASAAQAKEREACAKVCEQQLSTHGWAQACLAASAIRARGQA